MYINTIDLYFVSTSPFHSNMWHIHSTMWHLLDFKEDEPLINAMSVKLASICMLVTCRHYMYNACMLLVHFVN